MRERLDEATFEQARTERRALTFEQAVAFALGKTPSSRRPGG
jgi:hypothetical protein